MNKAISVSAGLIFRIFSPNGRYLHEFSRSGPVFSTKCNIYISRLCYDVSVRLSVTFVHCGHWVQWIPDIFACLDRWMSLLLTDNTSSGSSDRMMPGFLFKMGGFRKISNCSDITYFTYWESGPETRDSFVYINDVDIFIIVHVEEFLPRDALLSTVYAVVVCLSVCLCVCMCVCVCVCVCVSHSGIVLKWLNVGSRK